jgi:hypothetical protein
MHTLRTRKWGCIEDALKADLKFRHVASYDAVSSSR